MGTPWVISKHPMLVLALPSLLKVARPCARKRCANYSIPLLLEDILYMVHNWTHHSARNSGVPLEFVRSSPRWEGMDCIPELSWVAIDEQLIAPAIELALAEDP
jgi:hypothetical protein